MEIVKIMGTSAIIFVQGVPAVAVYKHWDGYTEATLPWLEKFNKEFTEKRANDPEYKFAQLLRSSVRDAKEFGLDESDDTGWGVVTTKNANGDFEYHLLSDGTVTVKEG